MMHNQVDRMCCFLIAFLSLFLLQQHREFSKDQEKFKKFCSSLDAKWLLIRKVSRCWELQRCTFYCFDLRHCYPRLKLELHSIFRLSCENERTEGGLGGLRANILCEFCPLVNRLFLHGLCVVGTRGTQS